MKNVTIKGVEFEIEVDFDLDGRVEMMAIFLPGSEVELSDVLDEKILNELEETCYNQYEGPEINEDDPRMER